MNECNRTRIDVLESCYLALREHTSVWSRTDDVLLSQALLLVVTDSAHRINELAEYWQRCQAQTGFFSQLSGPILNTIGVLGMVNRIEPETIIERASEIRGYFRQQGLLGYFDNLYSAGTSAYLALQPRCTAEHVQRMKIVIDGWKEDHPWVTGSNDLFLSALHAEAGLDLQFQIKHTEHCFQALRRGGHSGWADELQAAAQVVALWDGLDLQRLEHRYRFLSAELSTHFSFFGPNLRPAVSLLAASNLPKDTIIPQLMVGYERLGKLSSATRMNRLILSANVLLLQQDYEADELHGRMVALVIGVIYAQQAAAAAVAATVAC